MIDVTPRALDRRRIAWASMHAGHPSLRLSRLLSVVALALHMHWQHMRAGRSPPRARCVTGLLAWQRFAPPTCRVQRVDWRVGQGDNRNPVLHAIRGGGPARHDAVGVPPGLTERATVTNAGPAREQKQRLYYDREWVAARTPPAPAAGQASASHRAAPGMGNGGSFRGGCSRLAGISRAPGRSSQQNCTPLHGGRGCHGEGVCRPWWCSVLPQGQALQQAAVAASASQTRPTGALQTHADTACILSSPLGVPHVI